VSYKEGNLLSFKIIIDETGNLVTEISGVPEDQLHKLFKDGELMLIRKILKEARPKLEGLHDFLENELDAMVFTT
jgi:hypothetical protein